MEEKFVSLPDSFRVAPLHHPKPILNLADLQSNKEDSELYGPANVGSPPAGAHLSYHNGPLLKNVEVYTIFWGKNWAATRAYISLAQKLNKYFEVILVSPLIDQLTHEYSTPAYPIGHGSLIGTKTIR